MKYRVRIGELFIGTLRGDTVTFVSHRVLAQLFTMDEIHKNRLLSNFEYEPEHGFIIRTKIFGGGYSYFGNNADASTTINNTRPLVCESTVIEKVKKLVYSNDPNLCMITIFKF